MTIVCGGGNVSAEIYGLTDEEIRIVEDMDYTVVFKKGVIKQVEKIPQKYKELIKEKIINLKLNPFQTGVLKLKDSESAYRYRVGDYRILFTLDNRENKITIYKISHRKDVYE